MIEEQVITMILRDGTGTGIVECTIDEWFGISYKIPRSKIKEANKLKYVHNTGVYILFGEDEETAEKIAYIGEAEDLLKRIEQHNKTKDFWNECVLFMSENNALNKAHIKYIEHELYILANENNRYKIKNDVNPTKSSLSSADEIKARKFIEKVKVLSTAMGYRIFDKLLTEKQEEHNNDNMLYLKYSGEVFGMGLVTEEGFVILKGTKIREGITPGLSESLKNYCNRERNSEDIMKGIYINNHLVSSPSMAGVIILGRNCNGYNEWKNGQGISLKKLIEK